MEQQALIAEAIDSVRAHYASGHFSREVALARIKAAGGFTDAGAADMLDDPRSAYDRYSQALDWPGTVTG